METTIDTRLECSDGHCGSTLPAWSDGVREFPERIIAPNRVNAGQTICDSCLLSRLDLTSATYLSDDNWGETAVYTEDEVAEAFDALGYQNVHVSDLDGRYDPQDTLHMTRYVDQTSVINLARTVLPTF